MQFVRRVTVPYQQAPSTSARCMTPVAVSVYRPDAHMFWDTTLDQVAFLVDSGYLAEE